ncbi:phosphatidylserine decarboxylase [bacterium]
MGFIIKDGFFIIKVFLIAAASSYVIGRYFSLQFLVLAAGISLILALYSCYFFRNPKRVISVSENEICSPADGSVIDVTVEYNKYLGQETKVIRIFLSILDVHLQRAPIKGTIENMIYTEGKFLPAMGKDAHNENERNTIVITGEGSKKVACTQIAGFIARRIVMWKQIGDNVNTGDLYGMIKFGSQVNIHMPENVEVLVKTKDKVKAGETIIARWIQ